MGLNARPAASTGLARQRGSEKALKSRREKIIFFILSLCQLDFGHSYHQFLHDPSKSYQFFLSFHPGPHFDYGWISSNPG